MNTKCVVDTAEVYYTPKNFLKEKPPNTRFKDLQTSKSGKIPQKDRQTTH